MTGNQGKARTALLIATAVLLVAAAICTARGRSRLVALRTHRRILASLDVDLARLAAYDEALALLSEAGPLPEKVPLPVSVPEPASCVRDVSATPGGWNDATFSLRWEAPARTALEALAALCNLDGAWRLRSFSLRPMADGEDAVLEVMVATGRPSSESAGD